MGTRSWAFRWAFHLLAATILLGLGGCGGVLRPSTWAYKSTTDDPVPLAVTGPVMVDVESFNGDVTINADPRNTLATVTVRRQATHGWGRAVESDRSLATIQYSANIVPSEFGDLLQIRTWTTGSEPWFQRAHVRIDVPLVDGVSIRTSNGNVTVKNIEGEVHIETSHGDVRLLTNRPMIQPVSIRNRYGDIDYRIRAESTAEFDCQTVDGSVDQRCRHGRLIVHSGTTGTRLLATLNDGKNPVRLRTVQGDIRVAVVADATDVGVVIRTP